MRHSQCGDDHRIVPRVRDIFSCGSGTLLAVTIRARVLTRLQGQVNTGGYCCPGWWDAGAILMKRWPVTACGRELSGERPVMLSEITGGQYSHIRTDPSLRSGGDTATGTGAHIMMISCELWGSILPRLPHCDTGDLNNWSIGGTEHQQVAGVPNLMSSKIPWNCRDRDQIWAQELRRGISLSLSLINCFHRIAGAGTDIAELVAGARRGVGAPPPDCLALLTSYVTDVFWVEILSRADLVMQLLQPLSQSLTGQSKQEQEMINNKYFSF